MELKHVSLFNNTVARGSVVFVVNSDFTTDQVRTKIARPEQTKSNACTRTTSLVPMVVLTQCWWIFD